MTSSLTQHKSKPKLLNYKSLCTLTSPRWLAHRYDQHTTQPAFIVGSPVWLSIPTAGKLDPRWKRDWVIKSMKSSITAEICDSKCTRVVHTNRLQHCYLPGQRDCAESSNADNTNKHPDWAPPSVDHFVVSPPEQSATSYPQRSRRPPDWYRP